MRRTNRTPIAVCWVACALLLWGCGNGSSRSTDPPSITIAVAANMQFAMEELTRAFTEKTGISCQTTISSSGKLTAQIKRGAPFDVFVSANMKYPQEILRSDMAAVPPKIYAYGKLVLWSMIDDIDPSMELLTESTIEHIAMANPQIAPYGVAARDVLTRYGLLETVNEKLVFGESIAQTNQFIITGAAEVGFTAMSVVLSPQMKEKGKWVEMKPDDYSPIEQGVVVIDREAAPLEEARAFYDFLSSAEALLILEAFGYAVPVEQ